jgi:hypothetical protein
MDDSQATSLEQIRAFLAGSEELLFAGGREEVYRWVEQTLVRYRYARLRRPEKGLLRQYLARMTGLSRAQVTRLITGFGDAVVALIRTWGQKWVSFDWAHRSRSAK